MINAPSPTAGDNNSPNHPIVQIACVARAPAPVFAVSEAFATNVANTVVAFAQDTVRTERDYSYLSRDLRELDVIKTRLECENIELREKVRIYRTVLDKLQGTLKFHIGFDCGCACPNCDAFLTAIKGDLLVPYS